MAETENKSEALEKSAVAEASVNTQADAPKKNAVAAEPSKLSNSAEDLGPAVVKPTDSNPDATKKTKQVSGDPQQKSQGSADAMPKLKEEEVEAEGSEIKEGEMPKAALDALKKSQDKKEKSEDADAKNTEKKDETMMKASYKKEEIDVSDHVDALVNGETDLSEDFKNKAATIFETAIKSKVAEIAESMEADYNTKLEQESAKAKDELTEKVDSYLSYVVEEWMKENEIALERGIKGEIAEDFISGLKKLFAEHYIDVPDEKYDVLEAQATKIEDLESKLNEQIEKNVELKTENKEKTKGELMSEVSSDLADTQKEKFAKLAEEIEYSTAEDFKKKCETIKESYFGQKAKADESLDDVAADGELSNEDLSKAMAAYTAAISKTKDIKIS
tara:strand:- start:615 stop:1784 length:1170 start_codon:yes stop_codon:yes gene_type:complete